MAAPAIIAGAAIAGQAFNALSQGNQNKKNREFTREMWEKQNAVNDANWHRDNAYNSPANQRKLLEEGGYNPALMYDQGGFVSSSAPAAPSASSPKTDAPTLDLAAPMSAYYNAQMAPAQLDNLKSATENASRMADADVLLKGSQTALNLTDNSQKTELFGRIKEAMDANLAKIQQDTETSKAAAYLSADQRTKLQADIKAVEADTRRKNELQPYELNQMRNNAHFERFKAQLAEQGFTPNDSVIFRLLGKWAPRLLEVAKDGKMPNAFNGGKKR